MRPLSFSRVGALPAIVTEEEKLKATLEKVAAYMPAYDPVSKLTFNCFEAEEFKTVSPLVKQGF